MTQSYAKRNTRLLLSGLLLSQLISLPGCSKSMDSKSPLPDPLPQEFLYPFTAGNTWTYEHLSIRDHHDDRADDTATGLVTVVDQGEATVPALGVVHRFESMFQFEGFTATGVQYYDQRDSGLYRVAYCGTNDVGMPRRVSQDLPGIAELPFPPSATTACVEPVSLLEPPQAVLRYPITIGQEWATVTEPFIAGRRIAGWESVETPAGTFWCYKIAYILPKIAETEFTDYVAAIGLVKRTIISRNLGTASPELMDVHNLFMLTAVDLVE